MATTGDLGWSGGIWHKSSPKLPSKTSSNISPNCVRPAGNTHISIEDSVQARIRQLISESSALAVGNQNGQCVDPTQIAACSGWLTAAHNVVHLAIPSPDAPYRKKADRIAEGRHGYVVHNAVGELAAVLTALLLDAKAGLLASVADQARAETFDDFLDHANYYLNGSRKNEVDAIAGVVFEDSLRRICRKIGIAEKGRKLDALISELATRNEITTVKAKRARACADVRTKATHAQWEEFASEDVRATIESSRVPTLQSPIRLLRGFAGCPTW